jgi:hypothetical protein
MRCKVLIEGSSKDASRDEMQDLKKRKEKGRYRVEIFFDQTKKENIKQ